MRDLNTVTMICRLTKPVEIRHTPGGTTIGDLRVACTGARKDASGSWKDHGEFFDVVCFGKTAEAVEKYTGAGDRIAVHGRLEHQTWKAKDGTGRQRVAIVADQIVFLQNSGNSGGSQQGSQTASDLPSPTLDTKPPVSDDDIPF